MPIEVPRESSLLVEADRIMTICNACRYCEGLCAVFPAMERRRVFDSADLDFLANLCHNCGACLYDCQYAPPHQFNVGVPSTLAGLRAETWTQYAWPPKLGRVLGHSGPATAALLIVSFLVMLVLVAVTGGSLSQPEPARGAFYAVLPHSAIVVTYLLVFGYGALALAMSIRNYWRAIGGGRPQIGEISRALKSAHTLEYLDGGGVGCMNEDDTPNDNRRIYHHLTYYGFALCLVATTLAAILESAFGDIAPYPLWHPVVIFGVLGGIGLSAGPVGLLKAKVRRDPQLGDPGARTLEMTFLGLLMGMALTGFLTLVLRTTAAMPIVFIVHLGVVLTFAALMPYSKFVHGAYRLAALVHEHHEREAGTKGP